jgi:hypothetical protein
MNLLTLFREKFACTEENCCEGKNMADHFTIEEIESFLTSSIEALANDIDDTALANGFVGFTDEEWRGVQKFCPILSDKLRNAVTK